MIRPTVLALLVLAACTSGGSPQPMLPVTPISSSPTPLEHPKGYDDLFPSVYDPGGVPSSLRRPLRLPAVSSGGSCPTSPARTISRHFAPAVGSGPVYAVIPNGEVKFQYPPPKQSLFSGTGWGGQKVLWVVRTTYRGPVLVRGGRIDGSGRLGFQGDGGPFFDELQLPPPSSLDAHQAWQEIPTELILRSAGCYAFQADGTNFSEVVVFRAVETP